MIFRNSISRRDFLKTTTGLAALGLATHLRTTALWAQSNTLVVTLYGGTFEKAWRKNMIEPFEKEHGARVQVVTGLTMENLAKLRAQRNNPQIDVVTFDPPGAVPAAREGLLDTLDPERIPNLQHLYDFAVHPDKYYGSFLIASQGLAYNTNKIKTPPQSWEDLWNPEYKGKVLLPDITTSHGAFFVTIISKIYGKEIYDTDAAFEKIKTLRPSILTFYTSHDQVAQLLNQGEAWIVPWTSDRSLTQISQGAPIGFSTPKEGAVFWTSEMGIVKGAKNKELAEKYVNLSFSAEVQLANAKTMFLAPTNKKVKLEGELAATLPYGEKLQKLVYPDWEKMSTLRDGWADRWNREIK